MGRDESLIMLILQWEDGSLVMQIFVIGIDESIITQNWRDRMDYIRVWFSPAFTGPALDWTEQGLTTH